MADNRNGNRNGDSGARRLTDNHPPAYTDFFPSSMPCIFKTGAPWEVAYGIEAQPFIREVRPVYAAEKADEWRSVGQAIWKFMDTLEVQWTFVNPFAYANEGEAELLCPFVVVIGVKPSTVSFARAVEVATAAEKMLHEAGFAEAQVAVVEGETTRSAARGPQLLPFHPLWDHISEFQKPFTRTLGLSIAPLRFPRCGGTGALFYRFGGDDKRVALLTCTHVARPPHNTGTTTTNASEPREEIISPGSGAYANAVENLKADGIHIRHLLGSIQAWNEVLVKLGDPVPGEPEERTKERTKHLSLVADAREKVERAQALYTTAQARADPGKRVLGFVLHCEPIEVSSGPRGFTKDWALIELYDDMIDWDRFRGNQVYVAAGFTAFQYRSIMWPQAADSASYRYPPDGLLQANGIVQEDELRSPQHLDKHNRKCLLVVKNGATSGTTFGRVNGLESFVRRNPPYGVNETSIEFAVVRNSWRHAAFSQPGDSGSVVLDRTGKIVGMITGGGATAEDVPQADVSYITPYFDIHAQLTAKFPGIHLYPAVDRDPPSRSGYVS